MFRRSFLTLAAAAAALPRAVMASTPYTPGLVTKHLGQGDVVFLDFRASWCSTCAAQQRVINRLKQINPDYEANIVFIDVDWDAYGKSELAQSLKIPRRSTLVVLKGDQELGRLVAQTSDASIKQLMDTALGAAVA